MQLRLYLAIVRRFWVLTLGIPSAVALVSTALVFNRPPSYTASAKLLVSQTPLQQDGTSPFPDINLNYSWEASSFVLDDLPQVLSSAIFAQDVALKLAEEGVLLDPAAIQGRIQATIFHRSVSLVASADSPEHAVAVLHGTIATLQAKGLSYWGRVPATASGLSVAVLDPPGGVQSTRGVSQIVREVGLRTGLAIVVAVGLAFLLHYLDDRLQSREQAEEWTGGKVLGIIPPDRG